MAGKRNFTCVVNGKEHGTYTGSSPSSAARKAVSKMCGHSSKKVEFHLREITQGSKKNVYGPYKGQMEKLKEPIELKGRTIEYKPVAKLAKKSGGGFWQFGDKIKNITIEFVLNDNKDVELLKYHKDNIQNNQYKNSKKYEKYAIRIIAKENGKKWESKWLDFFVDIPKNELINFKHIDSFFNAFELFDFLDKLKKLNDKNFSKLSDLIFNSLTNEYKYFYDAMGDQENDQFLKNLENIIKDKKKPGGLELAQRINNIKELLRQTCDVFIGRIERDNGKINYEYILKHVNNSGFKKNFNKKLIEKYENINPNDSCNDKERILKIKDRIKLYIDKFNEISNKTLGASPNNNNIRPQDAENNKRAKVLKKLRNGEKLTDDERKNLNQIRYESKLKEMKESILEKVKEPFTKYIYPPLKEKINKKEPLDFSDFISGSDYIKYLYGSTNVYKQRHKNDSSISLANSKKYYHKDKQGSPAPSTMNEKTAKHEIAQMRNKRF